MTIPRLHFPHISRLFSAFLLWTLLVSIISLNTFLWIKKPLAYSDGVFQVFTHPFSATTHNTLAQSLWNSGARTRAGHELDIVAELSPVLGASTTAKAEKERADLTYWLAVVASHPDYRDAYVQLAALLYREGNLTQAHAYLVDALALDPNNTTVNRLTAFTLKLLE